MSSATTASLKPTPATANDTQVSLVSLVLFAASGLLVFVIIFWFVKRQINRFSLKSRREPHRPIGSDAPLALRREIQRRLNATTSVKYEPKLLREEEASRLRQATKNGTCHYFYRMKACDSMVLLDKELSAYSVNVRRKLHQDIRHFLLGLRTTGPLEGASTELVHNFCRAYDHAKHDPERFGLPEYNSFMDLLKELINCVLVNKARKSSHSVTVVPSVTDSPNESTALRTDILMHSGQEQIAHGKLDLHLPLLHSGESHGHKGQHGQNSEEQESLLGDDDDDTLVNEDDSMESGSVLTSPGAELKSLMGAVGESGGQTLDMVTFVQPNSGTLTHRVRTSQQESGHLLRKGEANL